MSKAFPIFFAFFFIIPTLKAEVSDLTAASVLVRSSDGGQGTGVTYLNEAHTFVWTDAHVVDGAQKVEVKIDLVTGLQKVYVSYDDIWIEQEEFEGGRKIGVKKRLAKVIRFSKKHDIALLKVYGTGFPAKGVEFEDEKNIPKEGVRLWHVGCLFGDVAVNIPTELIFGKAGKLRKDFAVNEAQGVIYDHVTGVMHPGSSGGGVFLQSNEKCVGLITEFSGPGRTAGTALMTPVRRLKQFSIEAKCEWAMNRKVKVPEMDEEIPTRDPIPVPEEMKPKAIPVIPIGPNPPPPPMPPANEDKPFSNIYEWFKKIVVE